jgi:hypothetical protein
MKRNPVVIKKSVTKEGELVLSIKSATFVKKTNLLRPKCPNFQCFLPFKADYALAKRISQFKAI